MQFLWQRSRNNVSMESRYCCPSPASFLCSTQSFCLASSFLGNDKKLQNLLLNIFQQLQLSEPNRDASLQMKPGDPLEITVYLQTTKTVSWRKRIL